MSISHLKLVILITLLAVATAACSSESSSSSPSPETSTPTAALKVVTTIYPVTYFTERVGGERIQVHSLVRPGVEAHDFEPTPGDIRQISSADVLIYVNRNFEEWVTDAITSVGGEFIVVETADLPGEVNESDEEDEHGHDHDGEDPHVWLNPADAIEQVRAIQTGLTEADDEGAAIYQQNADTLIKELNELDAEFSTALSSCTLDHIVVSHEAYGHLAERYGLEQIGLADLSAEFESTPQRVTQVIQEMQRLGVSHILQEPILSDALAETVAAETGAEILPLFPLEALTPDQANSGENFFTLMRQNMESLKTALNCQ